MKFISKDSRGFAISMDLLLALIPLTILLGMVTVNMDNMFYITEQTVFQSSIERVGTDAVDTLLETSGTPVNWEQTGNPSVVGLAKYDTTKKMPVESYLSPHKTNALQESYIQDLIGPKYGYYLKITRIDNSSVVVKTIGNNNTPPSSNITNVIKIERLVVTSNLEIEASLEGIIRATGEPRTYTTSFQTNDIYVASYDYWVLVINRGYDAASVDVNANPVVTESEIKHDITEVKKQINETYLRNQTMLLDNIVSVRGRSTPGNSMDVYIISAPHGTPASDISLENIAPMKCRFEFYIWVKG
ncbi:MAG: hypothetical protein FJ150_06720 [Euryarchaeota archaeon]|nr:hypothetical protein [Euryarchaeota archaeon]